MIDADSTTQCEALQREEYEVLEVQSRSLRGVSSLNNIRWQSIYPECISSEITGNSLRLEIPVEFDESYTVCVVQDVSSSMSNISNSDAQITLSLSSLPSLMISVTLPASYPLESPPTVTSIRASHLWLPHLSRLQKILTDMWQPGEGVLYAWIEFLRIGEFLQSLLLSSFEDQKRVIR
ncbi:hypothetical protein D9615_005196 [Tricholomella constricta]|uniref:RWD domain-containing protein n=1 Tax=Tricholomella constricta TaxID=117010 RepID=A0A8H5H6I1_9AGAR|nr:hypothetical protein D9615_005196 [Tricholomella constricta]